MELPEDQVREAGDLLGLFVKTLKTLRLYKSDNAMSRRLEGELVHRTAGFLERWGELDLLVRERALVLGDSVVLAGEEGVESLPSLLFRDGIRRLALLPGLEVEELRDLLLLLNRVGTVVTADEDLVTLLWERDLQHVRYVAVDELTEESHGPVFSEQLSQGFTGEAAGRGGGGGDAKVSLEHVKDPVAQLPVESCQLSEDEVDALQAELTADESLDPARLTVDLAVELALREDDPAEREALAGSVVRTLRSLLEPGSSAAVIRAVLHLAELGDAENAASELAELAASVVRRLALPEVVEGVLASLSAAEPLSEGSLGRYLAELGDPAIPVVVAWLGRLPTPGLRGEAADFVAAGGRESVRALAAQLETEARDPARLRGLLEVARRLAAAGGLDLVAGFLDDPDPTVRQQAARALPEVDRGRAQEIWIRILVHTDPALRQMAINAVVSSGWPDLAESLQAAAERPGFADLPAGEKRRLLGGVARLGGDDALDWLGQMMTSTRRLLFVTRPQRETVEAAAAAVRRIGSPAATALLEDLAGRGDRTVRQACRRALAVARGESRA